MAGRCRQMTAGARRAPVLPLLALLLAGVTYYGARGSLANFVLPWQHAYGASRGGVSLIVTASFLSIGAAQIVGGRLLERMDAWKVLSAGLLLGGARLRRGCVRDHASARGAARRGRRGLRRRPRRELDALGDGDAALSRAPRRALRPDRRRHGGGLGRDAADLAPRARRVARGRRCSCSRRRSCVAFVGRASPSCASAAAPSARSRRPSASPPCCASATSGCSGCRSSSAA